MQLVHASNNKLAGRLMDSREAASVLRRHHKTIERKAREGLIPGYFRCGRWYFFEFELYDWLRSGLHSGSQSRRVN